MDKQRKYSNLLKWLRKESKAACIYIDKEMCTCVALLVESWWWCYSSSWNTQLSLYIYIIDTFGSFIYIYMYLCMLSVRSVYIYIYNRLIILCLQSQKLIIKNTLVVFVYIYIYILYEYIHRFFFVFVCFSKFFFNIKKQKKRNKIINFDSKPNKSKEKEAT